MTCEDARYAVDAALFTGGRSDHRERDLPQTPETDEVAASLPEEASRHVADCSDCRDYIEDMVVVASRLQEAAPSVAPRAGVKRQVMAEAGVETASGGAGAAEPGETAGANMVDMGERDASGGDAPGGAGGPGWGRTAAAAVVILTLGIGGAWGVQLLQQSREAGELVTEAQSQITTAARVVAQQDRMRPDVPLTTPEGEEAGSLYFYQAQEAGTMVIGHLKVEDLPDPDTVWMVWRERDDDISRLGPVPVRRSQAPQGSSPQDAFFVFNLDDPDLDGDGPLPFRLWVTAEDTVAPDRPSSRGVAGTP